MLQALVTYLFAAMVAFVPLSQHAYYEKTADTEARYAAIAADVAELALDETEAPVFKGELGRVKTALLMTSIASYESHFDARTDRGISVRAGDNDNGKAVGLWQTHLYPPLLPEGWTRAELAADRKKAARYALRMVRESFRICSRHPVAELLGWYAVGGNGCSSSAKAESRVQRAMRWLEGHPFAGAVN
jgi:hypothetical protein